MSDNQSGWMNFDDYGYGTYPTIRNLSPSVTLAGRCGACGHTVILDRADLMRKLADDVYVLNLKRKLKCAKCGNRSGNQLLCRTSV